MESSLKDPLADTYHPASDSAYLAPCLPAVAADASTLAASQHEYQQHQFHFSNPTFDLSPHQQEYKPFDAHILTEGDPFTPAPHPSNSSQVPPPHSHLHTQSLPLDIRTIIHPPDLDLWRARLFHVDELIILSEEEFLTYFPHIDNVYSHRSTQHYKRKPLVSHYWDCRLKGRPPGTPKSTDPNKKKRKRMARERDLCDVKIKITEYLPAGSGLSGGPSGLQKGVGSGQAQAGAGAVVGGAGEDRFDVGGEGDGVGRGTVVVGSEQHTNQFGMLAPPGLDVLLPQGHPGLRGQRFFTIQRVNGNGANGKNDGVSGGHRHTLEESDRVKKNSVQRFLLKEARQERRKMVSVSLLSVYVPF
ncbi:uncharacterized protein BP01DRAFT_32071 [Aspergillus saccharolyticus JOP 1030-1]|uniref:Uncharacterized protein n=1 Tax=Aspergillus saccharolyticus JOP 1030-1 TaxID=1450539 RepID=A0A318ZFT0_9EURO|nr:hypothetical protein BP01DRAFT_32071 [Aspergillus saccharolyticus JOP 1030-1]PYH45925.1 hypothetical protein BP01DRAFT_32071 [Aspergillus saccharolyticus JOP 1030-1]